MQKEKAKNTDLALFCVPGDHTNRLGLQLVPHRLRSHSGQLQCVNVYPT
jgi:hypothetical protein